MNYIWGGLIVISIIFGTINGKLDEVTNAMFSSVKNAVEIALALIGIMAFWLGIVKIAQKTELVSGFAKLISPILRLIFNELPKTSPAFSNIALNFSANMLGLANAATPFGIKAMQDLQKEAANAGKKRDTASNSMCIFLGMNTAGFQLIPASVIAILLAAHADNPTEIILPTLIVTSIAFVCAIIIAKILAPFFKDDLNKKELYIKPEVIEIPPLKQYEKFIKTFKNDTDDASDNSYDKNLHKNGDKKRENKLKQLKRRGNSR